MPTHQQIELGPAGGLEVLTARMVAHRGLHGPGRPENSLAAFDAAARAGYAVEADIHITVGGEALVFHDHTLDRMCQMPIRTAFVTPALRNVARLDATNQGIPTLAELVDVVAARVPIFLDVKPTDVWSAIRPGGWRDVCSVLAEALAGYQGPVGIMAWDPRQLRWFADHLPRLWRIQAGGVANEVKLWPGVTWVLNQLHCVRLSRPHAISYNASALNRPSVQKARAAGLPVLAWTVRTPEELAAVVGWADNIIFEGFLPAPVTAMALAEPAPDRRSANLAEPCSNVRPTSVRAIGTVGTPQPSRVSA